MGHVLTKEKLAKVLSNFVVLKTAKILSEE